MKMFDKIIIFCVIIINVVSCYDLTTQKIFKFDTIAIKRTAHISPEIINELIDFENLIPTATLDEIVAEHYVVDGNFRTAFKYLRSDEFTQLQKQLLNVPEIIDILEFLHFTTANATTTHMDEKKIPARAKAGVKATLDEYNNDAVTVTVADSNSGYRVDKVTTNSGTIITHPNTIIAENVKDALDHKKVPRRPQHQFNIKADNNVKVHDNNDDADDDDVANKNTIVRLSNEQQPLVRIVLLEDLEVKVNDDNKGHQHHHHHHKYHSRRHNSYHQHGSLGTFTSFVEQVLQHLPHNDYQNMIIDKCRKNAKFAEFYQALRSPEFKSLIEQTKLTANILKIIETLRSHNVDVNSLQPIAFQVISWGPDI